MDGRNSITEGTSKTSQGGKSTKIRENLKVEESWTKEKKVEFLKDYDEIRNDRQF